MEVVISERRVILKKHFFGRDEGNKNDKPFAQRGRRKIIDQFNSISLDTTREWKNFIDYLAGTRGVQVPGYADESFYEPISATWERETVAKAA
jgi:hypothetical protein